MNLPAVATAAESPQAANSAGMALAAIFGGELARETAVMESVLAEFQKQRYISRDNMNALRGAVAAAHRLALRSQQIARLAGGRLRQSHERLELHNVVADIVGSRERELRRAGIQVELHLREIEVIVDPGLLVALLEAVVDWAAGEGRHLQVWLEMKNWPEHALLSVKARELVGVRAGEADGAEAPPDNTTWVLMQQLALAMGVMVERFSVTEQTVVQVEFPRTVRQLEGLTAVEVDAGSHAHSSYANSEPRPLAGHRVLLVTADDKLKREVAQVCESMGLVMDASPSVRQAVRYCELDIPHMILVDERLHDEKFDELREDLLRHDINYPFVEIATGHNVFEVSSWMGNAMSRVSRDTLGSQLASVIAMELAKVV